MNLGASFIVSTFHRPEQLRVVLASLAAQTRQDFEVLVADNSTDREMLWQNRRSVEFFGERFRHFETAEPNWCLSANRLAELAHGEYLSFPSDDAYYPPRWLAWMLNVHTDLVLCDALMDTLGQGSYRSAPFGTKLGDTHKDGFLVRRAIFPGFFTGDEAPAVTDALLIESLVARGASVGRPPVKMLWIRN